MKINGTGTIFPVASGAVRQKKEKENQQNSGQNPEKKESREDSKQDRGDAESVSANESEVDAAIAFFSHDQTGTLKGLKAESEGRGPGLKVQLKDAAGKVIRQMTGTEFLELREKTKADPKSPGKLLDKKL